MAQEVNKIRREEVKRYIHANYMNYFSQKILIGPNGLYLKMMSHPNSGSSLKFFFLNFSYCCIKVIYWFFRKKFLGAKIESYNGFQNVVWGSGLFQPNCSMKMTDLHNSGSTLMIFFNFAVWKGSRGRSKLYC